MARFRDLGSKAWTGSPCLKLGSCSGHTYYRPGSSPQGMLMLVGQDQLWGSFMLMVQAPKLGRWLQG